MLGTRVTLSIHWMQRGTSFSTYDIRHSQRVFSFFLKLKEIIVIKATKPVFGRDSIVFYAQTGSKVLPSKFQGIGRQSSNEFR